MPAARPFRCFNLRVLLVALAVAALVLGASWIGRGYPLRSAPRILAGLIKVAAFLWLTLEVIRSIRRLDELEQRIHVDALAIAGTITVIGVGSWGFLEKAGLPAVEWSKWILSMLSVGWALAVVWIGRRYR